MHGCAPRGPQTSSATTCCLYTQMPVELGGIGNRLTGSFHGTLTSQNTPPNPPVTIENGTFSIDVGG